MPHSTVDGHGPTDWHLLTVEEVTRRLETDAVEGLPEAQIPARLDRFGPNALPVGKDRSSWAILFDQLCNLVVGLLLAAVVLALISGDLAEALAIAAVIAINAAIGYWTERKSSKAIAALRDQFEPTAVVRRGGAQRSISAAELVPGDLVQLQAGCRVPADGRIVQAERLAVVEALLTGEAEAVSKQVPAQVTPAVALADRVNMVYMGTWVTRGHGWLLVTATGTRTEIGAIGQLLEKTQAQATPLEIELARISRWLVVLVLVLCTGIVGSGLLAGHPLFPMLEVGVSLAIAAVPESLPAIATLTLALGVQRMARLKTLVRRLPAVEALGSTTVICTDKTGTLTRNLMTARVFLLGERRIDVVYRHDDEQSAEFRTHGQPVDPARDAELTAALRVGLLCNDAHLEIQAGHSRAVGDPTEVALLTVGRVAGLDLHQVQRQWKRTAELPFDSEHMLMETTHAGPGGAVLHCVKGGPRAILNRCAGEDGQGALSGPERDRVLAQNQTLAEEGFRVLALAEQLLPASAGTGANAAHAGEPSQARLRFVGLVGLQDPIRSEVANAVATCRRAGIRTIMITGDQTGTACAIAAEVALGDPATPDRCTVVHGQDLDLNSPETVDRLTRQADVFARVSPEQKLRIVEALQAQGHIVAMTGDGVNDAPALKRANVGVAMGQRGAEIARESADLIITDDNFATIVVAVEQGRTIYENITKSIQYLVSCNLGEVLIVSVAIALGWPLPLLPLQILWLNLVTDVFPALALAVEPADPDVMSQPPRNPDRPFFWGGLAWSIVWQGLIIAAISLAAYGFGLAYHGRDEQGLIKARTIGFTVASMTQIVHAFNVRSRRRSILSPLMPTNTWLWAGTFTCLALQALTLLVPPLRNLLGLAMPDTTSLAVIIFATLMPLLPVELAKLVGGRIPVLQSRERQRPTHSR